MKPPPPPPPAQPPEELVEETLIRIPPDDPAHLLRAALVCKRWCHLISSARFQRRYREFHRTPPMLGALINQIDYYDDKTFVARFVPATSFRQPCADFRGWQVLDSRDDRVLLHNVSRGSPPHDHALCIWDPIADERLDLPNLPRDSYPYEKSLNGAVLCLCAAGSSCNNHLDCSFLVVIVGISGQEVSAWVYSMEDGVWSESSHIHHGHDWLLFEGPPCARVRNALYFMFFRSIRVLKYNFTTGEMDVIHLPHKTITHPRNMVLMATKEGDLGFATIEDSKLQLWSREAGHNREAGWDRIRVIDLKTLHPDVDTRASSPYVVRFVDGPQVIFVRMDLDQDLFSIDLKSGQMRKVHKGYLPDSFIPYMSFYTPALGAVTGVKPRASTSSV